MPNTNLVLDVFDVYSLHKISLTFNPISIVKYNGRSRHALSGHNINITLSHHSSEQTHQSYMVPWDPKKFYELVTEILCSFLLFSFDSDTPMRACILLKCINLNPLMENNYIHYKVWDKIALVVQPLKFGTDRLFHSTFTGHVNTYLCWMKFNPCQ